MAYERFGDTGIAYIINTIVWIDQEGKECFAEYDYREKAVWEYCKLIDQGIPSSQCEIHLVADID